MFGALTVCDINAAMLEEGRRRAEKLGLAHIQWMQGDAEKLSQIEDNTFDAYTIAFGIRNVVHIDQVINYVTVLFFSPDAQPNII